VNVKRSFEQFEKKKLLDHQSLKRSFLYSKSSLPNGVLKYKKYFEKSSDLPQSRPKSYRSKETTNKRRRRRTTNTTTHDNNKNNKNNKNNNNNNNNNNSNNSNNNNNKNNNKNKSQHF